LTPELSTHILAMGENVEVLEPVELREEIKRRLEECLTKYKL
jgi:predicted DNA-binding transcriptional regulator YafY